MKELFKFREGRGKFVELETQPSFIDRACLQTTVPGKRPPIANADQDTELQNKKTNLNGNMVARKVLFDEQETISQAGRWLNG